MKIAPPTDCWGPWITEFAKKNLTIEKQIATMYKNLTRISSDDEKKAAIGTLES
jgi:hypothetical protein